jgi:hypothetical protein
MTDPFAKLRRLAANRDKARHEWLTEIKALRAAGFSVRAIAGAAGVSHDTVWKAR